MCKNYNGALIKFKSELSKCHDQFHKFTQTPIKKVDNNYFGFNLKKDKAKEFEKAFNPMSETVECLKAGLLNLTVIVEDRVSLITGDLIEPLEMYISHHEQTSESQFDQAKNIFHEMHEKQMAHAECKQVYN